MRLNLPFKINWLALSTPLSLAFTAFIISALTIQINGAEVLIFEENPTTYVEGEPDFYTQNIKEEIENV